MRRAGNDRTRDILYSDNRSSLFAAETKVTKEQETNEPPDERTT